MRAVLEVLQAQPDDEIEALHNRGCNGCRTCRHPGPWKQPGAKHSKAGCEACGTLAAHNGCGGCIPRPGEPCECPYHLAEGARTVDKAIRRAAGCIGCEPPPRRQAPCPRLLSCMQPVRCFRRADDELTARRKSREAARTYARQRQAAEATSRDAMEEYGVQPGQRLSWLRRPSVEALFVRAPAPPCNQPRSRPCASAPASPLTAPCARGWRRRSWSP